MIVGDRDLCDLQDAFKHLIKLADNRRRKREVVMEIVNLVRLELIVTNRY